MAKRLQSPSSINTFKQCPRKYYYQYIKKIPTVSNIHQIRGNIAHSTLEDFFDIDIINIEEENFKAKLRTNLQKLLLSHWNKAEEKLKKLDLSDDQEKFYFEETMLMIVNWANQFFEEVEKVMKKKQVSFHEAFQELTPIREQRYISEKYYVRGFIDAIEQVEDEVHIVDYKTNSNFDFKDSIKLQLAIYSLLYFEKHGKKPSKVGIFFLRHKKKMMDVDEQLLELAKKEISLIHEHTSTKEDIIHYPQSVSPLCKWRTGQCDFYEVCQPHKK